MRLIHRFVLPTVVPLTILLLTVAASGSGRSGIYSSHEGVLDGLCEHGEACLYGKLERAMWREMANEEAWNEASGRDLRNFPPDRIVDYEHMRLEMRFEDLATPRFTARETLRFEPIAEPTSSLALHAVELDIRSVTLRGKPVEQYHDGEMLTVTFDPPLPVGRMHEIVIEYVCEEPYDGLFFTPPSDDAPHYTPEVHTQGQTESNRHWFVAHDFPNEMMTTELIVNVPAGFQVSGNGALVSHEASGDREIWHWLQDKPHVSYLVSLVIGQFDIVRLPHPTVEMHVWAPKGMGELVEPTYGNTAPMIDLFEKRFGLAYPWARYDQLIVKNFGAGGMENTSATNMYPTAILDERALLDRDLDSLIAHELAHQWTGDLLTCKSWEHIWLNEGWATYGSALWFEDRDGEDGLLDTMRRNFGVARRDRTTNDLPMVSPIYTSAGDTFRRAANPYPKGASILHMLRCMLGDETFWEGVHLYMNRHQHQPVETSDFRYALEEVSGLGLEWFFDQWCYRPGSPNLAVTTRFEPKTRELRIDIEQTQQIDWRTPAFRFSLPVWVRIDGRWQTFDINVYERSTAFRRSLDGTPEVVAIDPHLHVLKLIEEDKSQPLWRAQLEHGPTIIARHDAIDALGGSESPEHLARLIQIAGDEATRYTLRNSAIDAIAGYASPEATDALKTLLSDGVGDARVRSTLVTALEDEPDLLDTFARIADTDESYATRVAAIDALREQEAKAYADLIAELVHYPSQHEQVRNAALRAIAALDDPRGLDLAMQYAAYGHTDRARPRAIEAVGELAHHDSDRAVEFLMGLLNDPEPRTVRAAGSALAEISDDRARDPFSAMARSHRDPGFRRAAERWLERLDDAEHAETSGNQRAAR